MPLDPLHLSQQKLDALLDQFRLGRGARVVGSGAGTASPAVILKTASGPRFYLKRRNPRYCDPQWMLYDAEVARRAREAGLPVAEPLPAADGRPWVEIDGEVYQVSAMLGGQRCDTPTPRQLLAVGRVLRRWHEALRDRAPSARKKVARLHDPRLARGWLAQLRSGASGQAAHVLAHAIAWLDAVEQALPDEAYWALPQTIVHGDVHPANLHFRDDRVVGIFDYDWVCPAPRLTDLADALIYMAGVRPRPLRDGDIRTLTQPFRLPPRRVEALLRGYGAELTRDELAALGWLMLARWFFSRADAARRKVPPAERLVYVVSGLLRPVAEIRRLIREVSGVELSQ
ncbi:MAG: phosphotransferase [Armatimonadetes bacterium]|nr:phosphotransferase [Armatimonadota bacterium]